MGLWLYDIKISYNNIFIVVMYVKDVCKAVNSLGDQISDIHICLQKGGLHVMWPEFNSFHGIENVSD